MRRVARGSTRHTRMARHMTDTCSRAPARPPTPAEVKFELGRMRAVTSHIAPPCTSSAQPRRRALALSRSCLLPVVSNSPGIRAGIPRFGVVCFKKRKKNRADARKKNTSAQRTKLLSEKCANISTTTQKAACPSFRFQGPFAHRKKFQMFRVCKGGCVVVRLLRMKHSGPRRNETFFS